jgi:hypothetical protein
LVPKHDQHVFLETLEPSTKSNLSLERQAEVIERIRAEPDASYAFFGPAGTSKTTFSVALLEDALFCNPTACEEGLGDRQYIWRTSAKSLADEHHAFTTGKQVNGRYVPEPTVTRRKIVKRSQNGHVPRLFLEEIDKVVYTEFRANMLFELVDSIYETKGQLVFASNLSLAEFVALFPPSVGEPIARRIGETMNVYNFF